MTAYQIFLQALDIYFWVFIAQFALTLILSVTSEYKENKRNAIKNGTYFLNLNPFSIIYWVLFILSIKLT